MVYIVSCEIYSMVTGMQLRSGRFILRWSVQELAKRSKVSTSTIKRIESQDSIPVATAANVAALKSALEAAGIEFIGNPSDGPGVRLHRRDQAI